MDQEMCMKIADDITNKLIKLCRTKKVKNKTILQVYSELLEEKYKDYHYDILSYIPGRLAVKGYEIVNANYFALKKILGKFLSNIFCCSFTFKHILFNFRFF